MKNDYITMYIIVTNRQLQNNSGYFLSLCRFAYHQTGKKSQLYATKNYFSNIIDKQEETLEKSSNVLSLCTEER